MEPSTFKVGNYEVKLVHDDAQLVIEAEDSTSSRFKLRITPEHVQSLTSSTFEHLQEMHAGLIEALEGKNSSTKVDISEDGMLTYSEEQMSDGQMRIKKFTLVLMDEVKRHMKNQDVQGGSQIEQLEARIAKLEQENNKLKSDSERALIEKIEELEKGRIPGLETIIERTLQVFEKRLVVGLLDVEKIIDEKLMRLQIPAKMENYPGNNYQGNHQGFYFAPRYEEAYRFDPYCMNGARFTFSNSDRTISIKSDDGFYPCIAQTPLPKGQKTTFSIKAESISSTASVFIGICPSNVKSTTYNLHLQSGVCCFFGRKNGELRKNNIKTPLLHQGLKPGSVLTVIVDLTDSSMSVQLNGLHLIRTQLDATMTALYDYYPFVELYNQGETVSFI